MDMHGNSHPDSGKLEQIISQFLLKSLHIILDSRIPSLRPHDRSRELPSTSRVKKSDKWFNLVLGDRPAALDNLNFWHRNLTDPMIIDVLLVRQPSTPSASTDNLYAGTSVETVIERWIVQYESLRVMPPQTGENSASYKKTYKKSIILLRSLYSHMRLLPAYRVFRQLSSSTQTYNFHIIYKVSSFCEPFSRADEEVMKELSFSPVEALPGRLCVSVTYRSTLSDFKLEPVTTMTPKIIMDYVGSPTTDPLRSLPSSEKGVGATSFLLRGMQPHVSPPFPRPHSWTSGFHRAAHMVNQPVGGSPPAYRKSRMPCDFPSPSNDIYGHRVQNYRPSTPQKANYHDEYQLSPPFSSSMSPSTPTHFYNGSPVLARDTSETAPVTIPLPISDGRSSRYLSPNFSDSSRHSLPPLSPRSTRHDSSSQESPSGIRSIKKLEAIRFAELNSGNANHYSGQKLRDSKDDSGRFSGLLSSSGSPRVGFSRSSSRLSFQDDLDDDDDFSCPFDVDDVDTSDSHASQNLYGKKNLESSSHTASIGKKSQDAAVGILVHMLRTAPPLRQDPSCYSSHSLRTDVEEGMSTASGFFLPRKTADALEELRSYREMKDLLLSKSGTRVVRKEEA
ncbi:PREDICTED: autophagy-related protein 13-like isoform X2 [Populus euphratica]|uniref:Autophagy-related protein 13-like isoform X2 n=1 Tax=Populus euphratica TaxID=75702 RepID=A0AAJ6X4T0_POPEU|nr:PREDICTED: autophagy-related protein 13-like isoform X2 [Populus euphratica]